jgi:hypothetical protein
MGPPEDPGIMESEISVEKSPIATIDRDLGSLTNRLLSAARRSYWFSGLAWAFGIAVLVGLLVPYQTTTVTSSGSTSSSGPGWTVPVVFLSLTVVLALALLALLIARREALSGGSAGSPAPAASQSEGGWVVAVQRAQRTVTVMKNVAEFSFVPLLLGTLILGEWGISVVVGTNLSAWWPLIGAVPVALLAAALYLITREWIRSYQTLLDRQVVELSRLEAEFLWRFTGTPA